MLFKMKHLFVLMLTLMKKVVVFTKLSECCHFQCEIIEQKTNMFAVEVQENNPNPYFLFVFFSGKKSCSHLKIIDQLKIMHRKTLKQKNHYQLERNHRNKDILENDLSFSSQSSSSQSVLEKTTSIEEYSRSG